MVILFSYKLFTLDIRDSSNLVMYKHCICSALQTCKHSNT